MNLPPSPPPSSAYSYAGPNYYSPTPTRWKNLRKLVPYVVTFVLGAGFGAAGASDDVPAQSKAASAPIVVYSPTPCPHGCLQPVASANSCLLAVTGASDGGSRPTGSSSRCTDCGANAGDE